MKRSLVQALVLLLPVPFPTPGASADPPRADDGRRPPWTTSRVQGSPEPPLPYVTERAFPGLKFDNCLDLATAPGSGRLFVVEQAGKIFSFPPRADVSSADLVIDLARAIPGVEQAYAIAFHPDFEKNRYCYVCYVKASDQPDGTHVARFRVGDTDPPTIDPSTETTIVTWLSGGHNGCCLKFGPDGFLYISTGDGGPANPPDPLRAGQDVSNLLSAILRVDVDHADGGRNYRIPPDNPFVGKEGVRGEIWAYGLRNPWRMSFDRETGDLWVGDVGWERWEMLNRIERGGNYGWAVTEGQHPTHPEWPQGPTPILPPTIEHPHSESSSITDGLTYYGTRLADLKGVHIYGDYDTGKIWGFRHEGGKVVGHRELADTTHRIVGFGEDRDGELYILDHTAGTIHRLIPNPNSGLASRFPKTLGETGLFRDVPSHEPASGVVPYSINAAPWADGASSERLLAIPGASAIGIEEPAWSYPEGSVLVKTLSFEPGGADFARRRRVETQLLHFDGIDWQPYTYRWNDEQTDAFLVGAPGEDVTLDLPDPAVPGGTRRQDWRFAGRSECQRCHNKWAGPPLGFNVPQLDREHPGRGVGASQLEHFASIGLIDRPIPTAGRPRLTPPDRLEAPLDARARSYLHANCAHCHQLHAGSAVLSKMTFDLPLERTDMIGIRPTQGTFGIHDARVIAPGDPYGSILLYRMSKLGSGRMPYIGSTEVDKDGLSLLFEWIERMPGGQPVDKPAGENRAADAASLARLMHEGGDEDTPASLERLLSSTRGAMMLLRAIDKKAIPARAESLALASATTRDDPAVRDLFERFLPPERRLKRLGGVIDAARLLSIPGDAARGRRLFFDTEGIACKSCHRIGAEGVGLGPDLTAIGGKLSREELLESILEPSKRIDAQYLTYIAETRDGRVFSGLLTEQDDSEVVLKDARGRPVRLRRAEIEVLVSRRQSLMPELQLRDLTAQQAADLLEYLQSLR